MATYIDNFSRYIRRYAFLQETVAVAVIAVMVYAAMFHFPWNRCWGVFRGFSLKFKLKFFNRVDIPEPGDFISESEEDRTTWRLKQDNVAVYAIQGRRARMEDRFNFVNNLEQTGTSIYGVFDGHGGEFAAEFTEKLLFKTIMVRLVQSSLEGKPENHSSVLTEEILKVDEQLITLSKATRQLSGTTALVSILNGTTLTVANVGDSRGVLCDRHGKAVPLSFDHKPNQLKERQRIEKAGGFISFTGVWRVAGVLATSRALGDYPLKMKDFVIANPDILTFDLKDIDPQFIILATDGLWDIFSNDEAVNFIKDRIDAEDDFGCRSIVWEAYEKGSLDNITVLIVNLMKTK